MPSTRLVVVAETVALILTAVLCIGAQQKSPERPPQHMSQTNAPVPASGNFSGLVDIGGGRKMFLECSGSGSPTVILESGYRNDADIWSAQLEPGMNTVFAGVARFTRVCAYDRPGTCTQRQTQNRNQSSHYIQAQEPQLVIDAIKQVVDAVRNPSTWTTTP